MVKSIIRCGDLEHSSHECEKLSPKDLNLIVTGNPIILQKLPLDCVLREMFAHNSQNFSRLFSAVLDEISIEDFKEDGLALYSYLIASKRRLGPFIDYLRVHSEKTDVFIPGVLDLYFSPYSSKDEKANHAWMINELGSFEWSRKLSSLEDL